MLNTFENEDYAVYGSDGVGRVEIDSEALTEAVFRWRRGEKKEALYWLEKSFEGREFDGLGSLSPEHLR